MKRASLLLLASLFLFPGCSPSITAGSAGPTNLVHCLLPKDQGLGSLRGAWSSLPINLVFDREFYAVDNGSVVPSMRRAMATWNGWSAIKGKQVFNLANDGTDVTAGDDIPGITDCSTSSYPPAYTGAVGIWKITTYGLRDNARPSCTSGSTLLPTAVEGLTEWVITGGKISGAAILLNFAEYNTPGKLSVDVESLLLHELGHVLGLLHSCNPGGTDSTSAPSCGTASQAYINAVMFPSLAAKQVRRTLQNNDYARVNCLY